MTAPLGDKTFTVAALKGRSEYREIPSAIKVYLLLSLRGVHGST
jgi:hypothetical protein